jgi:hypothetical protein
MKRCFLASIATLAISMFAAPAAVADLTGQNCLLIRRASSYMAKQVSRARTENFAARYQVSSNAKLRIGNTGNQTIIF